MTQPAIRTVSLARQFNTVRALDDTTLEVPAGIIFGFLGPNGSGKTTMIRLLLGLLEPTTGTAEVLGFDTRSDAAAIPQRSGALLEHCGLYERLSAAEQTDGAMTFDVTSRFCSGDHGRPGQDSSARPYVTLFQSDS